MSLVREHQPNIIMNNRLFRIPEAGWTSMAMQGYAPTLDPKYGDFITPEQSIPDKGMTVDWETCMTMNTTWGFSEHDHAWKSSETLIRNLVDIASKGGNYLLNIGPKGDGSVPAESVAAMEAIGGWMKTNSESIYGTTASQVGALPWGRSTTKGSTVYLHVFTWPSGGKLVVPGVKTAPRQARLLGGGTLQVSAGSDGLIVQLPAHAPDPIDSVIALEN